MRVELRDAALEFLYSDSAVARRPCRAVALDVARGGTASAHVLVEAVPADTTLRLAVRGRCAAQARWYRLVDVPVEVNTGPVGFVEKEGQTNPHVARRALLAALSG